MAEGALLMGFVTLERLAELIYARANTARLIAAGGGEFGRAHYPLIVGLHAAWIAGLWLFGAGRPVDPLYLAAFVLLLSARAWVIATLGRRWTTRIIVVPGEALIRGGPYRLLRHPNYLVVALEFAVVPLALGLVVYAGAFFLLNLVVLAIRVRSEDAALAWATAHDTRAQNPRLAKPARRI